MNQNWKKRAALMSEEAKMKAQNEFQQKFMALRNEEMQFQNQIKQEEVQATQKIARPASAIINEMGKEKGFDLDWAYFLFLRVRVPSMTGMMPG